MTLRGRPVRPLLVAMLSTAALAAVRAGSAAPPSSASRPLPKAAAAPAGTGAAKAADDVGLFEFLGGIGAASEQWIDYLASNDPVKAAPAHASAPVRDSAPVRGAQTDGTSGVSQKK